MYFFKSYLLIVVLMLLVATSSTVHAAFPMQPVQTATTNTETVTSQTDVDFKNLMNSAIERFTQKPASEVSAPINKGKGYTGEGDGPGYGIASLACGLAGLLVPLLGIPAITFGKAGLDRRLRGLAIAGLVLGIIDLVIVAFAVIFVVARYYAS